MILTNTHGQARGVLRQKIYDYVSDEAATRKLVEYLNEEHKETDNIWFSEHNDDYYRDWRN